MKNSSPASHYIKCSDLQKSRFSSPILNMLKSSVDYENLHSTSPSHDKQILWILWKSAKSIFQGKRQKMPLNTEISVMVSRSLSRRMTQFCKPLYMKTKRVSYLISTGSDSSAECVCIRVFPFFHHKYLNWIIGQLNNYRLYLDSGMRYRVKFNGIWWVIIYNVY